MKELIGTIVSTKMAKTVVVEIVKRRLHPLYKKNMRKTKRYKAHNENLNLQDGDLVKITSHRPISKDKHYKVISKV